MKPHLSRSHLFFTSQIWFPLLVARLVVGEVFRASGWAKLQNLSQVSEFFASLSIPYPSLFAPIVSAIECVGGVFLILGLFTRSVCALLLIVMTLAIVTSQANDLGGLHELLELSELHYFLLLLILLFSGPGKFSADTYIRRTALK